jgi:hypothetical protein
MRHSVQLSSKLQIFVASLLCPVKAPLLKTRVERARETYAMKEEKEHEEIRELEDGCERRIIPFPLHPETFLLSIIGVE